MHGRIAVLLVHSFSPSGTGLEDFTNFLGRFGTRAEAGRVTCLALLPDLALYAVWVRADLAFTEG